MWQGLQTITDYKEKSMTGRTQVVRVDNNLSTMLILNTGAPQGCVLSPFLYSLFTQDCTTRHNSDTIIKFAEDTTVMRKPIG